MGQLTPVELQDRAVISIGATENTASRVVASNDSNEVDEPKDRSVAL